MDFLSYFVWGEVADKAVGVVNQEIKFDDFIVKAKVADDAAKTAKKTPILTLKKNIENCKEKKGYDLIEVYSNLYDYLVEKKIIDKKFSLFSFITFDSLDTINKDLVSESKLRDLIKIHEINEKPNLKCYNIDCKALSTLLTDYKYDPMDVADTKVFFVCGKKNIKRKNKTKRKNRRSSIKI